ADARPGPDPPRILAPTTNPGADKDPNQITKRTAERFCLELLRDRRIFGLPQPPPTTKVRLQALPEATQPHPPPRPLSAPRRPPRFRFLLRPAGRRTEACRRRRWSPVRSRLLRTGLSASSSGRDRRRRRGRRRRGRPSSFRRRPSLPLRDRRPWRLPFHLPP